MTGLVVMALASWMNIAAYTFDDVVRDIVPGRKGAAAVREIAGLLEKTSIQVKSDQETEKFIKFFTKTLEQFDFMKLYKNPYFKDEGNGFRGVTFQGCNRDDYYNVNIVTSPDSKCEVSRIWDYSTRYSLKKNDKPARGKRSFVVSVNSITATGKYSHRNGLAFIAGLLRVIDPVNIRSLNAPECRLHAGIQGDGRKIVNEFYRSFPRVSEFFDRYAIIRSLGSIQNYRGVPYTRCDIRYGYRLDTLKKDFPRLEKSLRDIEELYRLSFKFKNNGGHTIIELVFDSRNDVLCCSFYTRHGRFIPFDEAGNPVFNEEIDPATVKEFSYIAVMDMLHNVHGLKFRTDNVVFRMNLSATPKKGSLKIRLEDVQKTAISGSLYHFIPKWLIDLFVPSNMEQLIYDFSQVMVTANEGEGTVASFEWNTADPGNVLLNFRAASEFIDNYFIRYGLKIWSKKVRSDNPLSLEVRKLTEQLLGAFKADLERI